MIVSRQKQTKSLPMFPNLVSAIALPQQIVRWFLDRRWLEFGRTTQQVLILEVLA
jgi:hypothetical protein